MARPKPSPSAERQESTTQVFCGTSSVSRDSKLLLRGDTRIDTYHPGSIIRCPTSELTKGCTGALSVVKIKRLPTMELNGQKISPPSITPNVCSKFGSYWQAAFVIKLKQPRVCMVCARGSCVGGCRFVQTLPHADTFRCSCAYM